MLLSWLGLGCGHEGPVAATDDTEGSTSVSSVSDGLDTTTTAPGICEPGQARACYEGPPGTEGVGSCAAGSQVCLEDGAGWTACAGQVWPQEAERCDTPEDDDCDGWAVCEPTLAWLHPVPGSVRGVAVSDAGAVIAVGLGISDEFQGVPLHDTFVVSLDAEGTLQWAWSERSGGYAVPRAVEVDASGAITMVGYYDGTPTLGGGSLPPSAAGGGAFAVRYAADGTFQWHHTMVADGYLAVAVGPDGTAYVAGGYFYEDGEQGPIDGSFFVEAIDPDGERAWLQAGQGGFGFSSGSLSLAVTDEGEPVLAGASGGVLELGGVPIEVDGYQVVVMRLGPDGSPRGYVRLPEEPPLSLGSVRVLRRPGGLMTAFSMVAPDELGSYARQVLLVGMDPELRTVSEHRVGRDVHFVDAAMAPDGSTVLTVEFSGILDLGALGPGGPLNHLVSAVAAVDEQGEGRWAEVLYTDASAVLPSVAVAPDGAVVLCGETFGNEASLAGTTVQGSFLAMLRP